MIAQVKQRRDTAANWTATNPILGDGEVGYEKVTRKKKTGDGVTRWNSLPYDVDDATVDRKGIVQFASTGSQDGNKAIRALASEIAAILTAGGFSLSPATGSDNLDNIADGETYKRVTAPNKAVGDQIAATSGVNLRKKLQTIIDDEYTRISRNEKIVATVTFIDDDGSSDVMTRLKPIFDSKGIVGNCAIITGRVGTANYLTTANLATLHSAGWEFLGHGNDYTANLSEFPVDADLIYQLDEGCKQWLENLGYETRGFVFPQSYSDARIRLFTAQFYDYCFADPGFSDDNLMDTMQIKRIAIGNTNAENPTVNGNSDKNTLDYYKACVDYAVSNNAWLVFSTHISQQNATQDEHLADLIDYIQGLNIPIVTAAEGYRVHGNRFFAGDVDSGKYFTVHKTGKIYSSENVFSRLALNAFSGTDLISAYPPNSNIFQVNSSSTGWPGSGIVTTYRVGGNGYDYQIFTRYSTGVIWFRQTASDGSWGSFVQLNVVSIPNANTYTYTTAPSGFPQGVTYCEIASNHPDLASFPEASFGILLTEKTDTYGHHTRQQYSLRGSTRVYYRNWDPVGSVWRTWILQNSFQQILAVNPYAATDAITSYSNNMVTQFIVSGAGTTGWPDNTAGIVTTYRMGGNGFSRQEFRKYNTNELWSRYVDTNGAWTPFVKIGAV